MELLKKSKFNPLVFRVDGSAEIGIGHVMRCITLAEELSRRNFRPVFCTKPIDRLLVNEILEKDFEVSEIPIVANPKEDAGYLMLAVQKYGARVVILDGYNFNSYYLKQIRKDSGLLFSIDDIAQTYYCSDIVLNQNINATSRMYSGKVSKGTKLLLGVDYAILRPEFKRLHIHKRSFNKVNNILVTFGGADRDNQTPKVLKALEKVRADFHITVVSGISNPNKDSIRDYVTSSNKSIEVFDNAKNMGELMLNADIAISSGGSTAWELCCLGLPTLQIILAENQEGAAEELDRREVTVNLGWHERVSEDDIVATVEELINNAEKRSRMSCNGRSIVDGRGAERVASEI